LFGDGVLNVTAIGNRQATEKTSQCHTQTRPSSVPKSYSLHFDDVFLFIQDWKLSFYQMQHLMLPIELPASD